MVTGGGGFLGTAIIRQLVKKSKNIKSFSRNFYPGPASLGVEQIQGDIKDKNAVETALKDVDLVFHTAAKPGIWGDYSDYYNTNVKGTINIISGCLKHDIPLIHTSSPSVIFNGTDMEGINESVPCASKFHAPYPKTKALAEQEVIKSTRHGLKSIILRPHLIWGPGDNHLVPRILKGAKSLRIVGNGKNLVDTVYIDNAADAHILAAEKLETCPYLSGNIYFISQDEPVYLWDMVNAILKAGGRPCIKKSISTKTAFAIGTIIEFLYKLFNIKSEPKMTRFLAAELSTAHWFDISAAKNDLGYYPKISTQEGLNRLKSWLQEN
ncbi:putative 3-beta hydroxysteroid dehydrogenase/isomerase [Desulfonema limicola]|uniref:3-beta hydroxysteroid dehydrogenase/isomerase n=2 Tax=Desulfonema limicola TaxID=45656 RepID=A0A975B6B4_9BACT|nr:putative 3-beta hydroxysteroid dehydrogenase/isomerase [Desulfonema limicola]